MLSNQKLIEEAVKQYLQCTDTDYAIMINGKWGVGKTYFVKNDIDNIIQNQNQDLKLIYVSLYGLSSCKDLNHHVFTAVYPFTGTTGFKIGKAVTETILKKEDISFAAHDLDFPIKNAVLIFDDLERVNDKVTVHHMLGCINRYVEQKRIKTIIICDESQLNNNADYINTKEKIVRFTYSFNPDSKYLLSLANDMASKHGKEVCSAVSRNAAFIRSLSENDHCNIRIMNSTILMTSFLIEELKKHDIINYDDYVDYMFKCFMGYSVEINNNKQSYLDRLIDGNITPLSILFHKNNSSGNDSLDDDDRLFSTIDNDYSFAEAFYEKYFTGDRNPYLSTIALVICKNGICDTDDLLSEYEEFTRKRSPQDNLELLCGDFWKLEDSAFSSIVEDVLNRLRQGGVETTGKLIRVVDVLSFLVENDVISSIDENELLVLGKSCVDKISDNDEKSFVGYMQSLKQGILASRPTSEVAKNVLSYAEYKANSLSESLRRIEAQQLWSKIAYERNSENFYALFADNSAWMWLPFFSFMDVDFFVNKTINMRNETIISIAGAINRRYTLFQEAKEKLYADITPFESLIAEVDKRITNLPETATKSLKLFALEKLCEKLDDVVKALKSAHHDQQIN